MIIGELKHKIDAFEKIFWTGGGQSVEAIGLPWLPGCTAAQRGPRVRLPFHQRFGRQQGQQLLEIHGRCHLLGPNAPGAGADGHRPDGISQMMNDLQSKDIRGGVYDHLLSKLSQSGGNGHNANE